MTHSLAPRLQAALMGARASGKIAPSMCQQASRVALWLATHGVDGYWPDYVLDLHMVVGSDASSAGNRCGLSSGPMTDNAAGPTTCLGF